MLIYVGGWIVDCGATKHKIGCLSTFSYIFSIITWTCFVSRRLYLSYIIRTLSILVLLFLWHQLWWLRNLHSLMFMSKLKGYLTVKSWEPNLMIKSVPTRELNILHSFKTTDSSYRLTTCMQKRPTLRNYSDKLLF